MMSNRFMEAAIQEAKEGINRCHGGPFGAVVVKDGRIVGYGHNEVLHRQDPTCHGEIMAIHNACQNLKTWDLSGCELYTTAYPCPMCAGAIKWANIKKVYYGCNLLDTKGIGFDDAGMYHSSLDEVEMDRKDCQDLFKLYLSLNPESYQPEDK